MCSGGWRATCVPERSEHWPGGGRRAVRTLSQEPLGDLSPTLLAARMCTTRP